MITFSAKERNSENIQELILELEKIGTEIIETRKLQSAGSPAGGPEDLLYLVDHCFPIKGKGTVITGTILRGTLSINDNIYIPHCQLERKVKSIQMFKQPIEKAIKGDRVGVLVTQFDAKLMERGIICAKGSVMELSQAIVELNRIVFFKLPIKTGAKFHVTVGHNTVMATFTFFGENIDSPFDFEKEYSFKNEFQTSSIYALIHFETPIFCPMESLLIASKLDVDINVNMCRLAFSGKVIHPIQENLKILKIYKMKIKTGDIDRVFSKDTLIAKNLFRKETNMNLFTNMKVTLPNGAVGMISSSFGKTGKFKVYFPNGFGIDENSLLEQKLSFVIKRYIFDKEKIIQ